MNTKKTITVELFFLGTTFMISLGLLSCQKRKITNYYPDGSVKTQYSKNSKNKIEGKYILFYPSGNIKETRSFLDGIAQDTSKIFFDGYPPTLKTIEVHKEDTSLFRKNFTHSGKLKSFGIIKNKRPIGKWIYRKSELIDSIVEFASIENNAFVNQYWLINRTSGDTINGKGNYYLNTHPKKVLKNEVIRIRVYLKEPFYSQNSNIFLVIPRYDGILKDDFSNWKIIEKDTLYSLKYDGIPHPELPDFFPSNHVLEFGLRFEDSGNVKLNGILVESIPSEILAPIGYDNEERRIYWNSSFTVD